MAKAEFELKPDIENEELLSSPPQVELIAITSPPPSEVLKNQKTQCLAEIESAIGNGDLKTAACHLEELRSIIAQEQDRWQAGSSPTILAGESARSCYSPRLLTFENYANPRHALITDNVIASTRKAGHLTTRQHPHFVFGISGISRKIIHEVFHPHPFYNSEQVSQRYVTVKEGNHVVPRLSETAQTIYQENARQQMNAYLALKELMGPIVAEEFYKIFPARQGNARFETRDRAAIEKKTQEIARYVLGIDTHAFMYHTVNALTLLRYWKTSCAINVPAEASLVIKEMIRRVVEIDPKFLQELEDPLPLEETPEFQILEKLRSPIDPEAALKFVREFDGELDGLTSKLISFMPEGERVLVQAVRAVLGISKGMISDEEAIRLALDPKMNKTLGDVLNITTMMPLSRAIQVISYTFAKKLSHTADSQDQRHRMVPAARPVLATHYTGKPDFIVPELVRRNAQVRELYEEVTRKTFAAINRLIDQGVPAEKALLRLQNNFPVRFIESGNLLNLRHKYLMRLCFNAQREIHQASRDEVEQISQVHPAIAKHLLAPCGIRRESETSPYCPEGERFCGVSLWNYPVKSYPERII